MAAKETSLQRRARRNRFNLKQRSNGRIRICVARSNKHIQVQLIDDATAKTLASASTMDKELKGKLKSTSNVQAAQEVGKLIAKRAKDAKITNVVFDRGGFVYHGRVKAMADAAREAGLAF